MRSQKRRNGANNTSKKMLTLDKDIVPIRSKKVLLKPEREKMNPEFNLK